MSNSLRPQGLNSPWNSLDQNTGVVAFPFSRGSSQPKPRSPALQADSQEGSPGILEWISYPFSSRSSQPNDKTRVSCIVGGFFTN